MAARTKYIAAALAGTSGPSSVVGIIFIKMGLIGVHRASDAAADFKRLPTCHNGLKSFPK